MGIKGTGQEFELGIIKATTWHTAIALDAGSKVKIEDSGPVLRLMQDLHPDRAMGHDWIRQQEVGRINQEFSISGILRYENAHWVPVVQLIGTETGSVSDSTYTHQVDMDEEIDGVFYTAAAIIRHSTLGSSELFEWPSIKAVSWEITTGDDGFMRYNIGGIADTFLDTGHSDLVNTTTTVGTTSTYDTEQLRIPFGHCRININDQDGADFNDSGEGTDRVFPIGVSITASRPMIRDFDANRLAADSGTADTYKTSEPVQDGMFEDIFLTLDFSETDSNDYIEELRGNTAKKAEVYFYSTASRSLKFQFPNLLYEDIDVQPAGPGRIPQIITFRCAEASVAPTGMTGIVKPFRMTLVNSWSKQYDDHSAIT